MFPRLMWKECREKRALAALLALATWGPMLYGTPYTYLGGTKFFGMWVAIDYALALLLGLSTYNTETAGGAADFLCSRPVSWKQVVGAKVLVGAILVALAVIPTALVYHLLCRPEYVRFATAHRLMLGLGVGLLAAESFYLVGVACSLALPGVFGGFLAASITAAGFVGYVSLLAAPAVWKHVRSAWSPFAWGVGLILAFVILARFGVTLSTPRRVKRYVLILAATVAIALPLDFLVPHGFDLNSSSASPCARVCPDGRYAVVGDDLVRLKDGKKAVIHASPPWASQPPFSRASGTGEIYWTPSDTAYTWQDDAVSAVQMRPSGRAAAGWVAVGWAYDQGIPELRPSPTGEYLLVASCVQEGRYELEFCRPDGPRRLHIVITDARDFWWQSETQVGYIDARGGRHIVRVQ